MKVYRLILKITAPRNTSWYLNRRYLTETRWSILSCFDLETCPIIQIEIQLYSTLVLHRVCRYRRVVIHCRRSLATATSTADNIVLPASHRQIYQRNTSRRRMIECVYLISRYYCAMRHDRNIFNDMLCMLIECVSIVVMLVYEPLRSRMSIIEKSQTNQSSIADCKSEERKERRRWNVEEKLCLSMTYRVYENDTLYHDSRYLWIWFVELHFNSN